MSKLFSKFIVVGALGFAVDFFTYMLFLELGLNAYFGRILAFLVAVQVTYILNKKFTFSGREGYKVKYFVGQSGGVGINYLVFVLFFKYITPGNSIFSFLSGSIIALSYNFIIANRWVFKDKV